MLKNVLNLIKSKKIHNIYLSGPLGAGKTFFAKQLIYELTNIDNAPSPTFNIVLKYQKDDIIIYHYDLYRIDNDLQLDHTLIFENIQNENVVTIVEWPEKIYDKIKELNHILLIIDKNHQIKLKKEVLIS